MQLIAQVKHTIKRFKLFEKQHKLAVAASGGKDSSVLLFVLTQLGYKVEAITVTSDVGSYSEQNLQNLRALCKTLGVKLHEYSFKPEFGYSLPEIIEQLKAKGRRVKACTICGVLRRHLLNRHAKALGFDRLATGHNLDDEAQSTLMNIFRNDQLRFARQGPMPGNPSNAFVQRVKPLYMVEERQIEKYSRMHNLPVKYGDCPCATTSYRWGVKDFMKSVKYPNLKHNLIEFALSNSPDRKGSLGMCKTCREPANSGQCKACQILGWIK
jgi:uncharacterized protein (TIGR00269 family)